MLVKWKQWVYRDCEIEDTTGNRGLLVDILGVYTSLYRHIYIYIYGER